MVEGGKAVGVRVKKVGGTGETFDFRAPVIMSNAGVYNTFQRLLPSPVAKGSYFRALADSMEPGLAAMSVFLGLDASAEELGLTSSNTWAFTEPEDALHFSNYTKLSAKEAMEANVPLIFVSFPSTKDPNWNLHPGRWVLNNM